MVVAADSHGGHALLLGAGGAGPRRELRGDLAEAAVSLEHGDRALVRDPLRFGQRVDAALLHPVQVHRQQADAVREVAAHVRVHQDAGDQQRALVLGAGAGQRGGGGRDQLGFRDVHVRRGPGAASVQRDDLADRAADGLGTGLVGHDQDRAAGFDELADRLPDLLLPAAGGVDDHRCGILSAGRLPGPDHPHVGGDRGGQALGPRRHGGAAGADRAVAGASAAGEDLQQRGRRRAVAHDGDGFAAADRQVKTGDQDGLGAFGALGHDQVVQPQRGRGSHGRGHQRPPSGSRNSSRLPNLSKP